MKTQNRIEYYAGQKLTADDLRDDLTFETRLRQMNLVAQHNTWGVALGYEIFRSRDFESLVIGPGVAYDCFGRDIVSSEPILVPAPVLPPHQTSGWFDLVICYLTTEELMQTCDPACADRRERPAWRWVYAGASEAPPFELGEGIRPGVDIPVMRVLVQNVTGQDVWITRLDYSTRRKVQAMTRPHIASGQETLTPSFNHELFCWEASISTWEGRFSQTPHYFASLAAYPFDELEHKRYLPGPLLSIHEPTPFQFTLHIRLMAAVFPEQAHINIPTIETILQQFKVDDQTFMSWEFTVNWFGMESVSGCPPSAQWQQRFFIGGLHDQ